MASSFSTFFPSSVVWMRLTDFNIMVTDLSTRTVYRYKVIFKNHYFGGYGHTGKWIQENIIFMRFRSCFKLRKKIQKLLTSS